MTLEDLAPICRLLVEHDLESIEIVGVVKVTKRFHRVQNAPVRETSGKPIPPFELPTDEDVLFHSTYEPRRTVDDLVPEEPE